MAYGTFSKSIVNYYNKANYTVDGTTYSNISIFKTNPSTQTVAPAVYIKGNKQLMENMNPNGISAAKVVAKCTAGPMTYGQAADAFYHLYKTADGSLWYQNNKISSTAGYPGYVNAYNTNNLEKYASFCIKTDGSVTIRWFYTQASLTAAAPYCTAIIAAPHPLVYASKSVFENPTLRSSEDGQKIIAVWGDLRNSNNHYDDQICGGSSASNKNRTFLGHKSDGSFFFVCCDSATMNLRVGAKLMCDLGCDYAVNEDGATATQMRVSSGYSGTYTAGKMTIGGTGYYGACCCAYNK